MNFDKNKNSAKEIFQNLSFLKEEEKEKKVKDIYKCLSLDNVNKKLLEDCLNTLSDLKKEEDYKQIIEYNKYSLEEKYINLLYDNYSTMNKEAYIEYLKYLYNTAKDFTKLIQYFDQSEILKLIEYEVIEENGVYLVKDKIIIENDSDYVNLFQKLNKNKNINSNEAINYLKELKDESYNFLNKFIYIKEMDYYINNQPIEKESNEILYYNYMLSYLYNKIITFDGVNIKFNTENFEIINDYSNVFQKIIFNNGENFDKTLEIFNLNLEAEKKNGFALASKILEDLDKANLNDIESIIKDFNNNNNDIKIERKDNIIKFKSHKFGDITIDIYKYNNSLINNLKNKVLTDFDFIYKKKINSDFNKSNYFSENDLNYFYNLVDEILKSPLLKEIWEKYSDKRISDKIDFYFDDENNRKFFISKINFLPYYENDLRLQGLTSRHELKVFLSGYPNILNLTNDKVNRILDLSKRVIIIIHEIAHFMKAALCMLTNGLIINKTFDENISLNQEEIEVGRLLENEIFGFKYGESNSYINIKQALKLLKFETYSKSIKEFKEYFNNKNDEIIINNELKIYLDQLNFNYSIKDSKSDINSKNVLCCSRTDGFEGILLEDFKR